MNITILNVETANQGKYSVANVAYKAQDGKVEGKKVMSFGPSAEVFKVVSQAQPGDVFNVKSEKIAGKDGKEYWNWTGIEGAGKSVSTGNKAASPAPRSTYETPEERAQKQVYIVRQSSISAALGLLTHNAPKAVVSEDAVIAIAKRFEDYVFNGVQEPLEEVEVV